METGMEITPLLHKVGENSEVGTAETSQRQQEAAVGCRPRESFTIM